VRVPALVLLGAAAACATTPPEIGEPGAKVSDPKAEASYQEALARVTQHREVYSALDTKFFCAATYQSADFREARVRRQAMFQLWPGEKLDQALAQERTEAAQTYEVVFGILLVDRRFDDFETRNTAWRLSLATDQGEVTPTVIRRIGRATEGLRAYYPYMGDFWVAYAVQFPLVVGGKPLVGPATRALTFRMGSALGQAEMSFPLEPVQPPGPTPTPTAAAPRAPAAR
jgi:hypothetical protein